MKRRMTTGGTQLWKNVHKKVFDEMYEDRRWFSLHKSVCKEKVDDEAQEDHGWFPHLEEYSREG